MMMMSRGGDGRDRRRALLMDLLFYGIVVLFVTMLGVLVYLRNY